MPLLYVNDGKDPRKTRVVDLDAITVFDDWIRANDVRIQFRRPDFSAPVGARTAKVYVVVTNGTGVENPISKVSSATAVDTGDGTATGRVIVSTQPLLLKKVQVGDAQTYEAELNIQVGSAGTFKLGLIDSASTGLDVSDTITVTFS